MRFQTEPLPSRRRVAPQSPPFLAPASVRHRGGVPRRTVPAARSCVERVRGGEPAFLEVHTYRFRPHSMFDPELYRDKQEVEEWKERDPLVTFPERLAQAGLRGGATKG